MKHNPIRNQTRFKDGLARIAELENVGYEIMAVASRSDGFVFILAKSEAHCRGEPRIWAGCHSRVTMKWYRYHVRTERNWSYPRGKRAETNAILDLFQKKISLAWSNRE